MDIQFEITRSILWNTAWIGALVLAIFLFLVYKKRYPGPWGLPYFGILHKINNDFHQLLTDMARKKYGDVFLFKVTGQTYVHLGSFEAVREALVKKADCFPQRMNSFIFRTALGEGLMLETGEKLKVHRKFFVQVLKELANKEALVSSFDRAVREVLSKLRESKGLPVTFMEILHEPYVEAVRGIMIGDSNKHLVHDILNAYMEIVDRVTIKKFFFTGSLASWYASRFTDCKEMKTYREKMESLLRKVVHQRESAIASGDVEDTIIDRYLQERNERREKKDPQAEYFDVESLVQTLIQLFGDFCTSVTPFIVSLMGDLALKQEVQEKMREEMLREIGEDLEHNPSMDDKVRLPYVSAVLKEFVRCTHFFPFFTSLQCTTPTIICGVHVPVGSTTVVNSYAANHDPKVYDEPYEFRPERFLSSGARKMEQPTLFGIGKRSCIGEAISMMTLFLFASAIVKNFVLKPEGDVSSMLFLVQSMKLQIRFIPANSSKIKKV